MAQKLIHPINKFSVNAGYKTDAPGYFARWGTHYGIDLSGYTIPDSRKFYASGNGVVLGYKNAVGSQRGVGKWLSILYTDVEGYGDLVARYYHLDDIHVKVGQKVDLSTIIATYGNTGFSTGEHIHFELDRDTTYWMYTPTLKGNDNGLYASPKSHKGANDKTTVNPFDVLYVKTTPPENQSGVIDTSSYKGKRYMIDRDFKYL